MIKQRKNENGNWEKFDTDAPEVVISVRKDEKMYKGVLIDENPIPKNPPIESTGEVAFSDKGEGENEILKLTTSTMLEKVENKSEIKEVIPETASKEKEVKAKEPKTKTLEKWLEISNIQLLTSASFKEADVTLKTKISKEKFDFLVSLCSVKNIG